MAFTSLSVRLVGITAVCLAAVAAPMAGPQRVMALAAFSLGVALASVMPGYDQWAAWIVGPSVLLLALAPPTGLWGLAALVALALVGFACFSFAGMERAVPALGLPLFTFAFRSGAALPASLLSAWALAVVAMVVLANRASPVEWGAWLGDDEVLPVTRRQTDHHLVFSRRRAVQALVVVAVAAPVAVAAAHALAAVVPAPGTVPLAGGRAGAGQLAAHPGLTGGLDTGLPVDLGDEIVLRVRAAQPRYWRGVTYDTWDGRRWSASGAARPVSWTSEMLPVDQIESEATTVAPVREEQVFTTVRDGFDVLLAPWRPVEIETTARSAALGDDGSIGLGAPLEAGASWRVTSDVVPATADDLRRADPGQLPAGSDVMTRYAVEDRVDPAVAELARTITAGAPTAYDQIEALEGWMAANITYSRDIPVLPEGRDAVTELLFGNRRGFCEQIGTALVVMLRSLGVPARLVVGYVPGGYDEATGEWVSRASDAHAWAEVYFPGIGWQGFDPTASVPLDPSGAAAPAGAGRSGGSAWIRGAAGAVPVVALAGAAWFGSRRWRRRRRQGGAIGPPTGPVGAATVAQDRFDRCGQLLGRSWPASSTIREKAADLEAAGVDPVAVWSGAAALEAAWFAREDGTDAVVDAEEALSALEAAVVAQVDGLGPGQRPAAGWGGSWVCDLGT